MVLWVLDVVANSRKTFFFLFCVDITLVRDGPRVGWSTLGVFILVSPVRPHR